MPTALEAAFAAANYLRRVFCAYCGKEAEFVGGITLYPRRKDLHHLNFWLCEPCGAYVGCHAENASPGEDGTRPLGRLANAELRAAKQRAHAIFDPIWKNGELTRPAAYRWLARELGIEDEACHIGEFDIDQCQAVIAACLRRQEITTHGQESRRPGN